MSALKLRNSGIISRKPAANYSANVGYTCTDDGTTATLSASATVPATGVILEPGKDATSMITVGILGNLEGTVYMKANGVINAGSRVAQAADGRVKADPGPGTARVVVGVAMEAAVDNDLIEVAPIAPMILP